MNKTTLFGRLQVLLLLLAFISGTVFAGNLDVNNSNATSFKLKDNTYSSIRVNNTVSGVDFVNVKTKEGDFTLFTIENYGFTSLLGDPKLPVVKKLIEVPLNATFDVEIIEQDFQEFNLSDYGIDSYVIPVQPSLSKSDDPESVEFVYNRNVYLVDHFLGQQLVRVTDLGIMRGVRIARLEIAPVFYNPVQNTLRVYHNLEVKVNF
ncbi:MAG: C25 family peptidase propeptide domain-containing protein, partial [Bacteroidales bacterium]